MTKAAVKKYIADRYGFSSKKIELLEYDSDPFNYVMFQVMGVQYQARKGELSIYQLVY